MLLFEHLVDVCPATAHFRSEPFHRSPLFVENRFDNMSYMKIRHLCVQKYRELLIEVEALEYPLSQQESPRYTHVSILTFLVIKLKFSRFPPTEDKRKRLFYYL